MRYLDKYRWYLYLNTTWILFRWESIQYPAKIILDLEGFWKDFGRILGGSDFREPAFSFLHIFHQRIHTNTVWLYVCIMSNYKAAYAQYTEYSILDFSDMHIIYLIRSMIYLCLSAFISCIRWQARSRKSNHICLYDLQQTASILMKHKGG